MPSALDAQCSIILYTAAASAFGIVLRTDNPTKARAALYRFRNALGDPELASLSIRVSPDDSEHELWILKNAQAQAPTQTTPADPA